MAKININFFQVFIYFNYWTAIKYSKIKYYYNNSRQNLIKTWIYVI